MSAPGLITDGVLLTAMRSPDSVAMLYGDETITYGDLAWRMCRVASAVDAAPARRVAVSLPNHPALIEVFLGATLAGAVVLLFDPKWPRAVLDDVLSVHQPHLFVGDDAAASVPFTTYATWREAQDPNRTLRAQPTTDMPFLVGFTSGTTGTPKGFIRSHASWVASFAASKAEFGISKITRVFLPGPLSHGLSLYAAIEALNAGGSVVLNTNFEASAALRQVVHSQANTIVAAPTILDLMLNAGPRHVVDHVTTIITAGSKLSPHLRQSLASIFPNARVFEYYGASELSFVTVARPDEGCPPQSVGRAFRDVEILVEAAPGEVGPIWVRSKMLSAGYVSAPDGVGFRARDGWATVGDQGRMDERGFLTLVGRDGDMMITGGLNVYPSEVEAVIGSVEGVKAVVVTGQADERWGQVVTAIVGGDHIDLAAIKAACAAHLPTAKHPRRWFKADDFAMTSSGKIDRAAAVSKLNSGAYPVLA
jgi:long-chain acyl-CoA synthetase